MLEVRVMTEKKAPISQITGKLQLVGVILVAVAIIATVAGAWWGPMVLFPGALLLIFGLL